MEHQADQPLAWRNRRRISARLLPRRSLLSRCLPACFILSCSAIFWLALDAIFACASAADQVRIGISRTISDAGYYIADAKGLFREEGLEVSIIGFNSAAQMIAPLGTGDLEVGGGTVSAGFYNAVGRGILMKIVADQASIKPGYGYSSLMVRRDHVEFRPLQDVRRSQRHEGRDRRSRNRDCLRAQRGAQARRAQVQ